MSTFIGNKSDEFCVSFEACVRPEEKTVIKCLKNHTKVWLLRQSSIFCFWQVNQRLNDFPRHSWPYHCLRICKLAMLARFRATWFSSILQNSCYCYQINIFLYISTILSAFTRCRHVLTAVQNVADRPSLTRKWHVLLADLERVDVEDGTLPGTFSK